MTSAIQKFLVICLIGIIFVNSNIIFSQGYESIPQTPQQAQNPQFGENNGKSGLDMSFDDFKRNFGQRYRSETQEKQRRSNFEKNMEKLKNADCSPCGVNSLFDRSQSQLEGLMGKKQGTKSRSTNTPRLLQTVKTLTVPSSFDWRKYNVVTPVKNQRSCGSCWAFAATAFLESQLVRRGIATNTIDLAEQFLLQCDSSSSWCDGGYIDTAINVGQKRGMPLESSYPYNLTFNYYASLCTQPFISYTFVPSNIISYWSPTLRYTDSQIITYLLQRPIGIAVNANDWVYYAPTSKNRVMKCSTKNSGSGYLLNHAVLLVGYTSTQWIIKNSWGTGWGVGGYVFVSRSTSYNCGVGYEIDSLDYKLTPVV